MDRINFPGDNGQRLGITHIEYLQDSVTTELKQRSILYTSPGIISPTDPKLTSSPLDVVDNGTNLLIKTGVCLLDSGELVVVSTDTNIAKPASTDSDEYVIIIRAGDSFFEQQITLFENTIQTLVNTDPLIELHLLSRYQSLVGTAEFLGSYSNAAGISLTHDSLTFRRWSSPSDVIHASKVGSGLVTDTNIHGTTLFDQSLNSEVAVWTALGRDSVLSTQKDLIAGLYKGNYVYETTEEPEWIPTFTLKYTPHSVVLITDPLTDPDDPTSFTTNYSFTYNARKREITLDAAHPTGQLVVHSLMVNTGNFYFSDTSPYLLKSLTPTFGELVTNDGQLVTVDPELFFDLTSHQYFPFGEDLNLPPITDPIFAGDSYKVVVDSNQAVALNPITVVTSKRTTDLNPDPFVVNVTFSEPSELIFLLGERPSGGPSILPTLDIVFNVTGVDEVGATISETYDFNTSSFAISYPNNAAKGAARTKFLTIEEISLVSTIPTAIDAIFQVLADPGMKDRLEFVRFNLTTTELENLQDLRDVAFSPIMNEEVTRVTTSPLFGEFTFDDPVLADHTQSSWKPGVYLEQGVFISRQLDFSLSSVPLTLNLFGDDLGDIIVEWEQTPPGSGYIPISFPLNIPGQIGTLKITSQYTKVKSFNLG